MENLKNSFEKDPGSYHKVIYRRGAWASTKQLLVERLEEIKKSHKISARVAAYAGGTDQQAVKLCFNDQDPGIVSRTDTGATAQVKDPGCIVFSQSDNGLINIIISLPYIENITKRAPDELLEPIEPDEITEEIIDKCLDEFFDLLTIWETGIVNNCCDLNSPLELPHPEIPTY
jgi:hypothetical protein